MKAAAGTIHGLYLKTGHGKPLKTARAITCDAGLGIRGDAHANRLSPRQVLITITSELEALRILPGALRENMVISCEDPDAFRPGAAIVTESGVEIRLTMFCEPCKRIAYLTTKLSTLAHRRGILGVFEHGGELRKGDAIQLIPGRYDALPESPYQKFLDFIATVPHGRVVRYVDVAIGMGAPDGFVRALPGYIRRSADTSLPLHRIVTAQGRLPALVPDQASQLAAEGVAVNGATVSLPACLWQG